MLRRMHRLASTSGRLQCELLHLFFFFQAHRETKECYRLFGMPAQANQDFFRFKRAAFYLGIKRNAGKVGLIFAKAAALSININTDSSPVAMGRTHMARTLLASSLLPPSASLPPSQFPFLECTEGHLIQSPLALAPCSTLFLLLSHARSPH